MITRFRLHIQGKVQGVFYRKSAQIHALSLNLKGWVRNLPDGSVEAEIEGGPEACQAMIQWCRQGPPMAQIRDVAVEEIPVCGDTQFIVRK
ncbi:MAG: acylphosphatase [Haliscomenobacter sp.]|nr:acylphosphatase [Haliscomenobacter sp.]MBK7475647.1 acylphosphatase [Haliscomenobacter sp.]